MKRGEAKISRKFYKKDWFGLWSANITGSMRCTHKKIINMAGKLLSVLFLYCVVFAIPVCYPAEDSGILPESDVIKGGFNKNGFHEGRHTSVA